MKGGICLYGKMFECVTEFVDVELRCITVSASCTNLIVIGEMFVYFLYIVFLGEIIGNSSIQFARIIVAMKQYGVSFSSVSPCTACFLEICFDRIGTIDVDNRTHIGLVYTHSESIGGHDDTYVICLPILLSIIFDCVVETGVIEGGADLMRFQQLGNLFGLAPATHVNDGTAADEGEDMNKFGFFVFCMSHDIGQVFSLETHPKNVFLGKA